MTRLATLVTLATVLLAGCGAKSAVPTAALGATVSGSAASWLTSGERSKAEQAIRQLMERSTPDGRVEITRVRIAQRLFGHRYPFAGEKRVIRAQRVVLFVVQGWYNDRNDNIHVTKEVEKVRPRGGMVEDLNAPEPTVTDAELDAALQTATAAAEAAGPAD